MERMTAEQLRQAQQAEQNRQAKNKFHAQRAEVDGIMFDSKREARRWAELRLLDLDGQISELTRQFPINLLGQRGPLLTRTGRQMRMTVDFCYRDTKTGLLVFEDAKGTPTRDYEVRRAVLAAMGIEVVEV